MTDDEPLLAALAAIQERGGIGAHAALADAVAHAEQFVAAIPAAAVTLADLGSGGGLPGLVIAARLPRLRIVLVERRHTRADLLRRAVRGLGFTDRVQVHADDVRTLAAAAPHSFDVVTARSFAAPAVTARWAAALLHQGGVLLVSEPPDDDPARWPPSLLAAHGLVDQGRDQGLRRLLAG